MRLFEQWRAMSRKKTKAELDAHYEQMNLEKGDFLAMILAGFITFLPLLLIVGAAILLMMLLFRAV